MSPKKPPDSTRARKARSVKPALKPQPKPATAGPTSPFAADNAFAKDLRKRLGLIHAVIMTVAIALETENAEHGPDFATVLTRLAADPLWGIIADRLGGGGYEDDDDEVTP